MKYCLATLLLMITFFANAMAVPDQVSFAIEGRKILTRSEAGYSLKKVCEKKQHGKKNSCKQVLDSFDVALAVKKDGEPFKVIEVDGRTCVPKTKNFATDCQTRNGQTNGVNTKFEVTSPSGYQVYAIRRVIGKPKAYKEVVYTPYSDFLDTAEVRMYGKQYLDRVIADAYHDLKKRKISSLVNRSSLAADRVPKDVIEDLILVEHIDHGRFQKEDTLALMREVYVTIGLNQGNAYNYAKSKAEARGLLQVIPETYDGLKKVYPRAGLTPDFVKGVTNHHNAVKAAILLADHDVGVIKDVKLRAMLLDEKNRLKHRDYVACAYNGGPARAMSILYKNKDHVRDNPNPENRMYVTKMRAVEKIPANVVVATLY